MDSSSIRGSGVAQTPKIGGEQTGKAEGTTQVGFPSGARTLAVTEADERASLQNTDAEAELAAPESDKSLGERKTENITDRQAGRIRQALTWVAGKLGSARSKGAAAYQGAAQGLKAFKDNPKAALKADGVRVGRGLKSLKERAVSLPQTIKNKMPGRGKGMALTHLKAVFNRSAKSVPPSPSLSVQNALVSANEKNEQFGARLSEARDSLQQARAAKSNLENLTKLLDDPAGFYKSGVEVDVAWQGEIVHIGGEGLDKARSVSQAMALAWKYKKDIRAESQQVDKTVEQFRSGKNEVKASHKKELEQLRKSARSTENHSYKEQLNNLKEARGLIKQQIRQAEKALKTSTSEGKGDIAANRTSLKSRLKVDVEHLKALKKEVASERRSAQKNRKVVQQEQKKTKAALTKYQDRLKKAETSYAREAARSGLNAAEKEIEKLSSSLAQWQLASEQRIHQLESEMEQLAGDIQAGKEALRAAKKSVTDDSAFSALKTELEQAKDELANNTQAIETLREQHRLDQRRMKEIR